MKAKDLLNVQTGTQFTRDSTCDMDCSECWIREIGNLFLAFANRDSGTNFGSCVRSKLRTIQILTSVTLFTEYNGNNGLEVPSKPTEARPPYLIDENTKTKQVSVWYFVAQVYKLYYYYFFRFVSRKALEATSLLLLHSTFYENRDFFRQIILYRSKDAEIPLLMIVPNKSRVFPFLKRTKLHEIIMNIVFLSHLLIYHVFVIFLRHFVSCFLHTDVRPLVYSIRTRTRYLFLYFFLRITTFLYFPMIRANDPFCEWWPN